MNIKELKAAIEAEEKQATKDLESNHRAKLQRMNDMLAAFDIAAREVVSNVMGQYPEACMHGGILANKVKFHAEVAMGKQKGKL